MADAGPDLIWRRPGGGGLAEAVRQHLPDGAVVTAFDDSLLATIRDLILEDGREETVELCPLSALVDRVATMRGLPGARRMTAPQLMAMIQHVARGWDDDHPWVAAGHQPGTARLLAEALTLLHYHETGPDDWVDLAASPAVSEDLRPILESLAQLESGVRSVAEPLQRGFGVDRVEQLLAESEIKPIAIKHAVVFVTATPAPAYEAFFRWLHGQGVRVTVIAEWTGPHREGFGAVQAAVQRLCPGVTASPPAPHWEHTLFTDEEPVSRPNLTITQAPDPMMEVEWALRTAHRHMQEGVPPTQIGILTRQPDLHGPLLRAAARRFGLPVRMTVTMPVLATGFGRFLLELLQALAGDDVRVLAGLGRSTYTGRDPSAAQRLEALAFEAHAQDDPWAALLQTAEEAGEGMGWLRGALRWRSQNREPRALASWVERLRGLFDEGEIIDRAVESPPDLVKRDHQAMSAMQRCLIDQVVEVASTPLSLGQFVRLAERIWRTENVVCTEGQRGIKVATASDSLEDFAVLLVLGMMEGVFPRRAREDAVLSDMHRGELSSAWPNRVPFPLSHDLAALERDDFVRVCGSARHALHFSYSEGDGSDRENVPSFYLEEIRRLTGGDRLSRKIHPIDFAPAPEDCTLMADLELAQALVQPRIPESAPGFVEKTLKAPHRLQRDEHPRLVALSDASECPFRAFVRHRLELRPPSQRPAMDFWRDAPSAIRIWRCASREEAESQAADWAKVEMDRGAPQIPEWEMNYLESMFNLMVERVGDLWQTLQTCCPPDPESRWVDSESEMSLVYPAPHPQTQTASARLDAVWVSPTRVLGLRLGQRLIGSDVSLAEVAEGLREVGKNEPFSTPGLHVLMLLDALRDTYRHQDKLLSVGLMTWGINGGPTIWSVGAWYGPWGIDNKGRKRHHTMPPIVFHREVLTAGRAYHLVGRLTLDLDLAIPGPHCATCHYAGLCRQSQTYREEVSP